MSISDRILLLKEGVMQQYSTPKDMYTHPANRFTAGFLGNPPINFLTCRMVGGKLMVQDCGHGSMELPVKKCVWEQTGLPEEQADLEAGVIETAGKMCPPVPPPLMMILKFSSMFANNE